MAGLVPVIQWYCFLYETKFFEWLMKGSPHFGKEMRVSLDWTDADILQLVMKRRLLQDGDAPVDFAKVWQAICVSHVYREDSFYFVLERSLNETAQSDKTIYSLAGVRDQFGP
ncbi:MAG: hypothetical protein ACXW3V_06855 [Methylocystis sp.]